MQAVRLLDYRPGPAVVARATPANPSYASSDLSVIRQYATAPRDTDVKVYGRSSGYITYRRTSASGIDKTYANFSDDGLGGHRRQDKNQPRSAALRQASRRALPVVPDRLLAPDRR